MEEHYQLLAELEKRKLFDIELRYNTNFSTLNFKDNNILEIWKKFKNVHVSASIDAAFKLGSTIRAGFDWEQFVANRKQMLAVCPETYFEIAPTVSSLNIKKLPELHQELVKQKLLDINNIYLNILERPLNFNIQQLSVSEKLETELLLKKHTNWLKESNNSIQIIKDFENICTYMKLK